MYRKSREDIKEWLPEKIEIEMPVDPRRHHDEAPRLRP